MGCRLGRQKETVLFRHNDFQHLEATLEGLRSRGAGSAPANIFVAVESVYSMDGDLAPLREILGVAAAHGALVIVDEAHGYVCQRCDYAAVLGARVVELGVRVGMGG